MQKSILLAGSGDLCRRAGQLLLNQGHEVWGLRRHPPAHDASGIRWLAGDLTRPETLSCLPRTISHAIYGPAPDVRTEAQYHAVFRQGPENLLRKLDAGTVQRLVFISSSAVYGNHDDAWVNEDTPPTPSGFNGRILLQAEHWLADTLPGTVVLRLAGLYGPGRLGLVLRLQQGTASVPKDGIHWANRIHIDDAARAAVHLLELPDPQACYVGADDVPHRLDELYDAIAAMAGARPAARSNTAIGTGSKRLCNARLRATGFTLLWPDAIAGYKALIADDDATTPHSLPVRRG